MKHAFHSGVFLLCLIVSASAGFGQGNCTIQTIAGTYAFNFTGSSTIVTGTAADKFHWNASYAPIAGVGIYTVKPSSGTADGSYWLVAGAGDFGPRLTPIPLHATFSINPDCTGLMSYSFGPYSLSEELTVLDNGNEIRSMAVQTAVPTSTWNTTSRRVVGACGQSKVAGYYLISCKSIFQLDATTIVAGTGLIRLNIARDGSSTGTFAGKFGPVNVPDYPVSGKFKANDDCTAEGTLDFGNGVSVAKGVFFNEGKEAYWLPLVIDPGGVPQPYGYCDIRQISPASPAVAAGATTNAAANPKNAFTTNSQIQLDGTASTSADGKPLIFAWTQPASSLAATITGANTATPMVQFTSGPGTYTFTLTVTDSTGKTATDTTSVTVQYRPRG